MYSKKQYKELHQELQKMDEAARKQKRLFTKSEHDRWNEIKEEMDILAQGIERGEELQNTQVELLTQPSASINILGEGLKALHRGDYSEINESTIQDLKMRTLNSSNTSDIIQNPLLEKNNEIYKSLAAGYLERLNIDLIELPGNHYAVPKLTNYQSVNSHTEGASIPTSTMTLDSVRFDFTSHVVNTIISNEALQDGGEQATRLIETGARKAVDDYILKVILNGSNATTGFNGLDNYTDILTLDAAGALTNFDKIIDCKTALMAQNCNPENIRLLANADFASQVGMFKDSTGQPLGRPGLLSNIPFVYSQAVQSNYGGGTDTIAYIGDWSQVKLAVQSYSMRLVERYADTNSTGFLIVIRMAVELFEANHMLRLEGIQTS